MHQTTAAAPQVPSSQVPTSHALTSPALTAQSEAASRGLPSSWWRFGQDRRLQMIAGALPLESARVLDLGCGIGRYMEGMAAHGARSLGVEVELDRARTAHEGELPVAVAVGEALPFPDESLDGVLLHEVLEHVRDDAATLAEVVRVLRTGGRGIVFVPNRGWPFETHGVFVGGRYRFGNIPLVNYLPDAVRNRLAPHVRVYTARVLKQLLAPHPVRIVALRGVFPGYDKLAVTSPRFGRWLRTLTYRLESTPLHRLGLSHFLVFERLDGG